MFYKNAVFLFVSLKLLGTFINVDWVIETSSFQTFKPKISMHRREDVIFLIIIGDVHQFIIQCLISNEPLIELMII